jgi:hypothetical protein
MLRETVRTHVVIPRDLVASVDEVAGKRARSRFIADAVAEKLARVRRQTVLRDAAGALADRDIPGWESSAAASDWVRQSRARDDERLARLQEVEGA